MIITIPHDSWNATLDALADKANRFKAAGMPVSGGTKYDVSNSMIAQEEFNAFLVEGVDFSNSIGYLVLPVEMLSQDMDSRFPDSTTTDLSDPENPVEVAITLENYIVNAPIISADGTEAVIHCVKKATTTGNGVGSTKDELLVWQEVFAGYSTLLCQQAYNELMLTPEWLQAGS